MAVENPDDLCCDGLGPTPYLGLRHSCSTVTLPV